MGNLLKRLEQATPPQNFQVAPTLVSMEAIPIQSPPILDPALAAARAQENAVAHAAEEKLRAWIVEKIVTAMPTSIGATRDEETVRSIRDRFTALYGQSGVVLSPESLSRLETEVLDEIFGYGPLEPLLADQSITEIMVNGYNHVYIEQKGRVVESSVRFDDDAHVMKIIDRIIRPLGRHVDRKWPMVDARLPDGSRVNAIIPPSAIDGPTITIRKFSKKKLTVEDLISFESLTAQMFEFLQGCVLARLNIIVSGGTGSGKTTLLNVLSNFIPDDERIVTIEDSAELQLAKPHVVRLEAKPADADGTGRVMIRDLVVNALRMRPERIVVGEVRSGEALDMLQAMNTGHDGSLTTIHANTPRDTISRLETLTLMSGIDFPVKVVREQIAAAIDLIVQISRMRDGSRKVVQITEVQGMEGDIVVLQDVFRFIERGVDSAGKVMGEMRPTGIRPKFMPRLEAAGIKLPPEIFGTSEADVLRRR